MGRLENWKLVKRMTIGTSRLNGWSAENWLMTTLMVMMLMLKRENKAEGKACLSPRSAKNWPQAARRPRAQYRIQVFFPPISHSAMIISIIPFCKCCTSSRYPTPHKHTHTHQILQMFSLICFLKTGWVTCFTIQVLSSAHPILSFCDCFTLFACLKHLLHNLFRPIRWSRSAII